MSNRYKINSVTTEINFLIFTRLCQNFQRVEKTCQKLVTMHKRSEQNTYINNWEVYIFCKIYVNLKFYLKNRLI